MFVMIQKYLDSDVALCNIMFILGGLCDLKIIWVKISI